MHSVIYNDSKQVSVGSIASGGSAEAVGIKVGDELQKIDGADVSRSTVEDLSHLIGSGAPGTTVDLTLIRKSNGLPQEFKVERVSSQSSMKCAEAAVKVMCLMFPLPVAIVSTIGKMDVPLVKQGEKKEEDLVTATIRNFLKEVKPFYVWSIDEVAGADAFEIRVHVVNPKASKEVPKEKEVPKAEVPKEKGTIKCTFKGLGGISVHEMQVAISNLLHKDYGVVPFAFAQMPTSPDSKKPSKPFSDFIDNISSSCLQCTKVLLIAGPPSVSQPAELFMLEQVTCDV